MMIEKVFINRHLRIKFKSYVDQKCRVWFQAKQVAQILEYKNTEHAIKRHVSENHKRTFLFCCPPETGGQQNNTRGGVSPPQQNNTKVKCCPPETGGQQIDTRGKYCIFLDEAGFYELVFRSRLPAAKMFREWVFDKVLPSIRKYGYYKTMDSKINQRVIIDGVKYYKHSVFSNYAACKNGDVINIKKNKKIKITKDIGGYFKFIIFSEKVEKPINYYQHRFVFEVFKGVIPKCLQVDHINEIKSDNRIKNLQLLTPKQNIEKSKNKSIISVNIENGKEKRFISIKKAAIELNINADHISKICRKKCKSATSKKDNQKYTFRYL